MPDKRRRSILSRFLQFCCCCIAMKGDEDNLEDNDDIIVSRVYKSKSAGDFVDMHDMVAGFPYMPKASRSDVFKSAAEYKVFNHKEGGWEVLRNSIPLDLTVGDGTRGVPIEDSDDLEIINAF